MNERLHPKLKRTKNESKAQMLKHLIQEC